MAGHGVRVVFLQTLKTVLKFISSAASSPKFDSHFSIKDFYAAENWNFNFKMIISIIQKGHFKKKLVGKREK